MFGVSKRGTMLTLFGAVFLMIAAMFPTKDRLSVTTGTQTRVITRQGDPLIYWAYEAGLVLLSLGCFGAGKIYTRHTEHEHSVALPSMAEHAGVLKKGCAFLAVLYLVWALLPYSLLGMPRAVQLSPEWVSRATFLAWSLLFGAVFYGLKKRTPIYWKLIPLLIGVYAAANFAGAAWSTERLSKPLAPFLFGGIAIIGAFTVFLLWWRKQWSFFA